MDINLKQRLIGAVILVSLAVIILPQLLSGTKESTDAVMSQEVSQEVSQSVSQSISQIPAPPQIASAPVTVLEINTRIREKVAASAAKLPQEQLDDPRVDDRHEADFALDKNILPQGWALQVGSFEHQDNARKLLARLRKEDYRAYLYHYKTATSKTWRVFVGPSVSRQALEKQAVLLEADLKVKTRIIRYKIEEAANQESH